MNHKFQHKFEIDNEEEEHPVKLFYDFLMETKNEIALHEKENVQCERYNRLVDLHFVSRQFFKLFEDDLLALGIAPSYRFKHFEWQETNDN